MLNWPVEYEDGEILWFRGRGQREGVLGLGFPSQKERCGSRGSRGYRPAAALSGGRSLCVQMLGGGKKGKNTPDLEMCELRCVPGMLQITAQS